MFGLVHRGELDGTTENELEHLSLRLRHLWLVEHNEDGTHKQEFFDFAASEHTHDAADIVSGELHVDRIPNLDASKITSGALDKARQHAQTAYKDEANVFTQVQTVNNDAGGLTASCSTESTKARFLQQPIDPETFTLTQNLYPSGGSWVKDDSTVGGTLLVSDPFSGLRWAYTASGPVSFSVPFSVSTAGILVTSGGHRERNRTTPMGEWQTYTPTFTNITIGNGTVSGRYSYVAGKTVAFEALLIFGNTTSITGSVQVSTPTAHRSAASSAIYGQVGVLDSSLSVRYAGVAFATTSPNIVVTVQSGAPVSATNVTSTVPMTWATSDQLYITGIYEEP